MQLDFGNLNSSKETNNTGMMCEFTTNFAVNNASVAAANMIRPTTTTTGKRGRGRGSRGSYKTRSGPRQYRVKQANAHLPYSIQPNSAGSYFPCASFHGCNSNSVIYNQQQPQPYFQNVSYPASSSSAGSKVYVNPEILRRYSLQG